MTFTELGNLLRKRREFLEITQEDMAALSGVAIRTVVQLENGTSNPSLSTIIQVAEILGLELGLYCKTVSVKNDVL